MKLFDVFRRKPNAATDSPLEIVNLRDPRALEIIGSGGSGFNTFGMRVNERTALAIPTVWRAINIIAGTMAGFPVDVVEAAGDTRIVRSDHPLHIALTRRPNSYQSARQFRFDMQLSLLLYGNAYALIVRPARAGGPLELFMLDTKRVEPKLRDDRRKEYLYTDSKGTPRTYAQDQILHLRGLSLDGVKGVSVITAVRETFALALQAQEGSGRLMKQGNFAGYGVKTPNKLTDKSFSELRDSLRKRGGIENAGDPPIFEQGLEPVSLGFNAADSQFLESRRFTVAEIARWFGLPPHMIGDTERSTSWGTGIEQQTIGFVTYTMDDWIELWSSDIEFQVLGNEPTLQVQFRTAGLLRGDSRTRWSIYQIGVNIGALSPNDVRRLEDMPPRDGGDEYLTPGQSSVNQDEPAEESENDDASNPSDDPARNRDNA